MSTVPEGVESPHVQHRQQLGLGFREGEAISQRLKGRHNQSLLGIGHVQLDYASSTWKSKKKKNTQMNYRNISIISTDYS